MNIPIVKMGSHPMIARQLFALLLFLLPVSVVSIAQSPIAADPTTTMPKDPVALMELAAKMNGLNSITTPWHLRATYQILDDQGHPKEQGVYEEWWAGPKKDKRVFTGSGFQQTDYVTEKGEFRMGDRALPLAQFLVRERLINPIPDKDMMESVKLRRTENPFPKTKLTCIEVATPMRSLEPSPLGLFPVYCFEMNQPMLRFSGSYGTAMANYQKIGKLNGHFLGMDFVIEDLGKPYVKVHLEQGNLLTTVNDAEFAPHANAIAIADSVPIKISREDEEYIRTKPGENVRLANGVVTGHKLGGEKPIYPVAAKRARIEGKVVLQATISEDGHIRQLSVVSAPDTLLAYASLVAVRSWTYEPYLLDGKPVEVQTQVNVIYKLGG